MFFAPRTCWLCCYLVLHVVVVSAQSDTTKYHSNKRGDSTNKIGDFSTFYRINKHYILSYFTDFPKVAVSPLHYSGKDWRNFGIVTAGAGLLLLADRPVYDFMNSNRSKLQDDISTVVEPFGNKYPPLLIGSLYLAGVVSRNRKIEHASLMAAKSMVFSTIFYTATKQVIRRRRPKFTNDPYEFNEPFEGGREFTSFPSGHSNTVFTLATALAIEFRETKWVPPVVYTIAAVTAASRLYDRRHWSSDVWVGAAFGHFITKALYRIEEKKRTPKIYNKEQLVTSVF